MSNEKLYTKCPHCGYENLDAWQTMGICWSCSEDMSKELKKPDVTVVQQINAPAGLPQPNIMTPDGRREVAIKMLEDLVELRLKMIRVGGSVFGSGNKLEKVTELTEEYQTLQEQILELMGVDS